MKVCIHQPVYYPWLGTIHKVLYSDRFVVFDDSPAVRPSWMNRVYISMNGERQWLSVPVLFRFSDKAMVRDMRINTQVNWEEKHIKTVRQYYSKAPFFDQVMALLRPLSGRRFRYLIDLDLASMEAVFKLLQKEVDMVFSSELGCDRSGKVSRLANITKAAAGTIYINGMGAESYFDEAPFHARDLLVHTQTLPFSAYQPFSGGPSLSGLSILDVVANIGAEGVRDLLARNDSANDADFRKKHAEPKHDTPERVSQNL